MAVTTQSIHDVLVKLKNDLGLQLKENHLLTEEPLRSELLNSEQMERHSKAIAHKHRLSTVQHNDQLLSRLADNEDVLIKVHELLTLAVKESHITTPAGEWLMDNFYLIEEQIRFTKKHFPRVYSERLPQLATGAPAGLPRVYDIALEIISHSDGRIDMEILHSFVSSYQTIHPISLGELWALPIMLRLALIENLRRVCTHIATGRIYRNLADYWAKRLISAAHSEPKSLILIVADMARSNPPLERAFVAELSRQLRGKGHTLAQPLSWLEDRLVELGQSSNELVQAENQKQAAHQVSVSNSIGSLRLVGSMDWRDFVESNSIVEKILREDAIYGAMDFSTRDQYRHEIERIAKTSDSSEEDVARIALALSREGASDHGDDHRSAHVGSYLLGPATVLTERRALMRVSTLKSLKRWVSRAPVFSYGMSVCILSISLSSALSVSVWQSQQNVALTVLVAVLTFLCASQLAVTVVNFLASLLVQPQLLPRMDYSSGVPDDARTLVVIPAMLSTAADIDGMIESLEVRFLANKDANILFGLVTDFVDSLTEHAADDEALRKHVLDGIGALNTKYAAEQREVFYLFHRDRRWNARDRMWMGYERKRGKLTELNGLLRGNALGCFSTTVGDLRVLQSVKYVITLDMDTQLPRDAARKMIGSIAHPLNRAIYDHAKKRVTAGYGILQPRVSTTLPGTHSTTYARLNGNDPGIDPYTRATSDVYQDLFDEGSFIGKGIYDVDVFEQTLKNTLPANTILSHDLLEGCYVRSGLLSDVQLFEKYPERYHTDMQRRHRWIRGDWQIAAWCLPIVPDANRHWHRNTLSALSRWKILDNMRRSLIPASFTLLVVSAFTLMQQPVFWTLLITALFVIPDVLSSLWTAIRKPRDLNLSHHVRVSVRAAVNTAINTGLRMICLPYEAWICTDAILRTLWRLIVSRRSLLEWSPSVDVERRYINSLAQSYRSMWIEPMLGLVLFCWLSFTSSSVLASAAIILISWMCAPLLTWWLSRLVQRASPNLHADDIDFLRRLARKTWAYFETFVNASEHWLPPDNFQEQPAKVIAHRTSPTNMGLSLLANLSACDFGYISVREFIERSAGALTTMQGMERYQGHFYNWYDTQTLRVLWPRYVSTVDSGNLSAHLLTLRQGILELLSQRVVGTQLIDGIADTLSVLISLVEKKDRPALRQLQKNIEHFSSESLTTLSAFTRTVRSIESACQPVLLQLQAESGGIVQRWKDALHESINEALNELTLLAPWAAEEIDALAEPGERSELSELETAMRSHIPTLRELARYDDDSSSSSALRAFYPDQDSHISLQKRFSGTMKKSSQTARERISALEYLAELCGELADIEFDFLYNKTNQLLTIGYNVEEHRCDSGYYDLLASEARLSTFVGIAQGKLPQESWFALGRLLTNAGGRPILLSWGGSMFEYLMPFLVMPTYENTLLDQTRRAAVERQIDYGRQRNIPWGISESGYNMVDSALNYQYQAFGVPGLGIKRGLEKDLVVAPYASQMALMVKPEQACENLQELVAEGFSGEFGLYEAIDYTASRLPRGQHHVLIQSYMTHHLGMSFLAMLYVLHNEPMQRRFCAEPRFQATLLLLQERIPKITSFFAHTAHSAYLSTSNAEPEMRVITNPNTPVPEVQLLSNGKYHVMITNSGAGYSQWRDMAVTRWREDATSDHHGIFCYLRDLDSGAFWSSTYQPTVQKGKVYEAVFSQGRADFRIVQHHIEMRTEIVVSPEDDIEMRRVHISNRSSKYRSLEVTSYAEVVIAPAASEAIHPAFSNLFVQTEIVAERNSIFCTRRPRSVDEQQRWMFHLMNIHEKSVEHVSFETDRLRFIGRGNTTENPDAMLNAGPLSGTQGSVLDPIVAIRKRFILAPDETVVVDMVYGMAESREMCRGLIEKYQDKHHKDRVFELAWTHNQVVLRQINASEADAQLYCRLANSVIFMNPTLRADASVLIKNRRGQPELWPYAISGDLPIVLLMIEEQTDTALARQLIQAHAFWRLKGLIVDLVIWNDSHGGYRQELQNHIAGLITAQSGDQPGAIFVRASEHMSIDDRVLFQTVARVVISASGGTLTDHVNRIPLLRASIPRLVPTMSVAPEPSTLTVPSDLQFFNGTGGFSADGTEYVMSSHAGNMTPSPWVNVIANPNFGTVISESGQAYTWSENAHEMRLSPWENDPVCDNSGEAFYLRDEESGHYWSASTLPTRSSSPTITRHGFGYSVFEHEEDGIRSELRVYVDLVEHVKFSVIRLTNLSSRPRRISVTGYTEWVLGDLRPKTSRMVVTEIDEISGALFARNSYNTEFRGRVAFFDAEGGAKSFTGDRSEFIGRNGTLSQPSALSRIRLSGRVGAGLDPCAAIQVTVELHVAHEHDVVFKLGQGKDLEHARHIVTTFRGMDAVNTVLEKVKAYWRDTLSQLQIETPDASLNILSNGWLQYQTLACRMWARSGYYQSGGAFGFRDQLQDVLSIMNTQPALARRHILLCASRQYQEGDVQHWWHAPLERGVRTRCSDDYLWLPYVCCRYVSVTADSDILNEQVHCIDGRMLNPDEESYYDVATPTMHTQTLYQHCISAIRHGLRFGTQGLALIGSGDWNDGMDKVGHHGKGESVWLSFFLYDVLQKFSPVARAHGDVAFAEECKKQAEELRKHLSLRAWDGAWYRRASFDDGALLGSVSNTECAIDSIAQSWSVLSGAGEPVRTEQALRSVDTHLVRTEMQLIQLLDPPFSGAAPNPGYIAGYVPGVRENGGQYTHAAIWFIMALAQSGRAERAWELLRMINPLNHALEEESVQRYKVEPYVMSADVYANPQHQGRGGWTWYTGAAGWMYQCITESLLGLRREGVMLTLNPQLPAAWQSVTLRYRYHETLYRILVERDSSSSQMLDSTVLSDARFELVDDGAEHTVVLKIG